MINSKQPLPSTKGIDVGVRHVPITAELAQLAERTTLNRVVEGSIPSFGVFWCSLLVARDLMVHGAVFVSLPFLATA